MILLTAEQQIVGSIRTVEDLGRQNDVKYGAAEFGNTHMFRVIFDIVLI